jgi:hypothetical protein
VADDPDEFVEPRTVRPYTLTGGRTRGQRADLPLEALVRAVHAPAQAAGMSSERRQIVELAAAHILSVAEISAHLHLPLGVVRVLVGDLAAEGAVLVHGGIPARGSAAPATDLKVLESVLNGISAL